MPTDLQLSATLPPPPSRAYWASVARYEQAQLRTAERLARRGQAVCGREVAAITNALLTARGELLALEVVR